MNKIIFSGYDTFHDADFFIDAPEGYDYYLFLLTRSPGQFWVNGEMRQVPAGYAVLYPPASPVIYGACGERYGDDWIRFESDETFVKTFSRISEPFAVSDAAYCHNLVQLLTWESAMGRYDGAISQLFHILFYTDAILIEPSQVALSVPVTVIGCPACPPHSLGKILFHAQTIVIEISDLAFRKRIPLLCQRQVTLKTFLILLRVEVFFDQFIADIQLSARLVIAFRHSFSPRSFGCNISQNVPICKPQT